MGEVEKYNMPFAGDARCAIEDLARVCEIGRGKKFESLPCSIILSRTRYSYYACACEVFVNDF